MKSRGVFIVSHALDLKPDAVHIEEALDIAGHGRYNYLLILACCTIYLGSVVDMLSLSILVPAARCDLQLSLKEIGMLTSISLAGFMFAIPWGYFADTYGRRKAILISSSVGFIISVINSFSTSFLFLLISKFIGSSFSTASSTLTTTYLGECIQKKYRSKAIFIQNSFNVATDIVIYGLAYIILPLEFNLPLWSTFTYKPWRLLSSVLALPLALGALMLLFLYESPKFLANKGEMKKALEVLNYTYKINRGNDNMFPVTSIIINNREEEEEEVSFWESISKRAVLIFKPPLLWRTIQLFYLLTACCAITNIFFLWFPTMVNSFYNNAEGGNKKNFCQKIIANISVTKDENIICSDYTPINTLHAGMLFSLFYVFLGLAIIKLSSMRKLLLVTVLIISASSAALLNLFEDQLSSIILFILIQIPGICVGTIGSYFVEVYPTSIRALASSLIMMATRFVSLGGVNLVGAVIVDHCQLTFYCCTIYVLSGVVVALFLPSDRKLSNI